MKKRRPGHDPHAGDLALHAGREVHGVDLGATAVGREAPPGDLRAVGAEEGPTVVAGGVGQAADLGAVRVHQVDVHHVRLVVLEHGRLCVGHAAVVGRTIGREHDQSAVGRVGTLGVVAHAPGQIDAAAICQVLRIDLVLRIEVPAVAALLPGGTEIQFRPHLRRGLRIGIGGRIQHPIAARMDPRAGRLARSGRDSLHVAGGQIEQVDLVERIRGVAFRLEDQALAVATEIALAGPPSLERKLPGIGQPACLVVGLVGRTRHRHQHDGAKRCDACPVPRRARDAAPTRRLTAAHDTHLNIPRD